MVHLPSDHDDTVKCRDQSAVNQKLSKFIASGIKNFQIVADFDYTMTTWHPRGTCFSAIRTYEGFGEEFLAKTTAIKNKHMPIHVDFTLPEEVRKESDHQWFTKMVNCFVDMKFNKSLLPTILESSSCRLRPGVIEFLKLAHKHGIPVLIFSGGITDLIDALLDREECNFDNISIISNKLLYDNEGLMVGIVEPYITASSKLEVARQNVYFTKVIRDNILLLGDMISDLKMASCAKYTDLLTVGFCNFDKDEEKYSEHFDMLIMNNRGFDAVNGLLKQIIGEDVEKDEL